jgi:hypothetical protein
VNLSDLQKLFQGSATQHELTPGEKAQTILRELNAHVLHMIVEQRALFVSQKRTYFIRTLAENLHGNWCPPGVSRADIEEIPLEWFIGMIRNILDGIGLGGYEERLYAHFISQAERIAQTLDVSDVPEPERRDGQTTLRLRSRRRMS